MKITERGKSDVNTLMESKILIRWRTTYTFNKWTLEKERALVWEMGRDAPFPTITKSLPI